MKKEKGEANCKRMIEKKQEKRKREEGRGKGKREHGTANMKIKMERKQQKYKNIH